MNIVKDVLDRANAELQSFETALRGALANQNISDIIASARAKLTQAASHPDAATDLKHLEPKEPAGQNGGLPFGSEQHGT